MTQQTWRQMSFEPPSGGREVLWVELQQNGLFRVLNVPVWLYGISVGTLVEADETTQGEQLSFKNVVEPSPGGTVRVVTPDGVQASRLYLERIGPESTSRGIRVGPATFLDPMLVAVHLVKKDDWWPLFGDYLNELIDEGVITNWEVGDPDDFPEEISESADDFSARELVHPKPTTDREALFRILG